MGSFLSTGAADAFSASAFGHSDAAPVFHSPFIDLWIRPVIDYLSFAEHLQVTLERVPDANDLLHYLGGSRRTSVLSRNRPRTVSS